jgi:hypothetical protein
MPNTTAVAHDVAANTSTRVAGLTSSEIGSPTLQVVALLVGVVAMARPGPPARVG